MTSSSPTLPYSDGWLAGFSRLSPLFEPLHPVAAALEGNPHWPAIEALQTLLEHQARPIASGCQKPVHFAVQDSRSHPGARAYETRVYLHGTVFIRPRCWHDLFNALVWMTFPQAKSMLNQRHYEALQYEKPGENRSRLRDALTLFDEGGVAIACCDPVLAQLLRGFEWKTLFWKCRERVSSSMKFFIFGHALYEKALQPYVGMSASGILVNVSPAFFDLPLEQQLGQVGMELGCALRDTLQSTRDFVPVPLLGIPGWAPNSTEGFYDNSAYFRPKRGFGVPA